MAGHVPGARPHAPPPLRLTPLRLFWGLLVFAVAYLLFKNLLRDHQSGAAGSYSSHDFLPFPGALDDLKFREMQDLSMRTTGLLDGIRNEQQQLMVASVLQRQKQQQQQQHWKQPQQKQQQPAHWKHQQERQQQPKRPKQQQMPPRKEQQPQQLPVISSGLSLAAPSIPAVYTKPDTRLEAIRIAPEAASAAEDAHHDPFSGVPSAELEEEKRRLSGAVHSYREGSDYKKHKTSVETYRRAIHRYKAAREARRRPYPPEPKAPVVTLPTLPPTHSLSAKCFDSHGSAAKMGKKFASRVTIMNQEVYKPKDLIVTWVRTVGAVSKDFWDALPASDPFKGVRYSTCAVVGSAGLLRTRHFGAQIDAHDAVFRFNSAYTTGLESYVGSKTTVRLMNRENFGFVGDPDELLLQHITTADMMSDFVAYSRLRPQARLYAIHPAFYGRVMTDDVEHPSNGYFGMRLALELCDCVRVYGFIRTWQGYMTYHYHDDYTPRKSQHSRDSSELPLIKGLLIEHLGRLGFAHPCILSSRCEGCPDRAAKCEDEVPYPVPTPGHCYGHGPPGGYPHLNPWEAGKFWPEGMEAMGGSAPKAQVPSAHPAKPAMNEQKPFLPFADERRSCFRACLPGDRCPGGAGGICPEATAARQPCLQWRDVSSSIQR